MRIQPALEFTVLTGAKDLENSLDNPKTIIPKTVSKTIDGTKLDLEVEPNSFNMWVIKYTD